MSRHHDIITMNAIANKVVMHEALIVRQMKECQSKQFGIYRGTSLIEGGFFSVWSAQSAAKDYAENGEAVITTR